MLRSLYIKNYALIEEISVEFAGGLNIITGETGAGKSILIDAMSLLLGERSSVDVVRKGMDKTIVEGVFVVPHVPGILSLLEQNGCESGEELIVRRELSAKGQTRCFVNDSPVSVNTLKTLGDLLVDLHGQHDHQSLLRPETHIEFLDDFGEHHALRQGYATAFTTLTGLLATLQELRDREEVLREKRQLYEFQIQEIDTVGPLDGEEEALEAEVKILENTERLVELTSRLNDILYDRELSIHSGLVEARKYLETLGQIDQHFADSVGEIKSAEIIAQELTKFVREYSARIEFNPQKLEHHRERLGHLSLLKKKFGGSIEAVLQHRKKIGDEVALVDNFESEITRLEQAISEQRLACGAVAKNLTAARKSAARKMTTAVVQALGELGIARPAFMVRTDSTIIHQLSKDARESIRTSYVKIGKDYVEASSKGVDAVEFLLSTNAGEDPKPLVKVASGGEVSRIMLALKSSLAEADHVPLLIFDEIDVGVSGRIGQSVGLSLKKLASSHQVIAITHLPQIAGQADVHFAVEKNEKSGRTTTILKKLEKEERVVEVAKLLSGETVTEAGLKSARELMGESKKR